MMKNNYEILSPAGSFESLIAGINCGCNAIYLGGEKFSARTKAINFSNEELSKAVEYAHLRNVKIYVTINVLIDDREMKDALEFTKYLNSIGVDGIIVQDLGFAINARRLFKELEVHASTQMAINNYYGAKFVESLGFERVVLARETELNEIEIIKKNTTLDIEAFIHGALCVAFSGECLMSSMIGARSGNRGDCAQPCRKQYEIYDLNHKLISQKAYILSTKDLNTLNSVQDLVERGVYSLKIEGRMKKPEYVAQIVKSYKKALENRLSEEDIKNTTQIFNRGFTKGLFNGDFGRDFSSYDRPDNRGLLVGEVKRYEKGRYILDLFEDIDISDGLEFLSEKGHFGIKSDFEAKKNTQVKYRSAKKLKVPSQIYKTSSKKLNDNLKRTIQDEPKFFNISLYGKFNLGKKPQLIIKFQNIERKVEGENIIEKANNKPTTKEKIISNLSKLGDTVYKLENIDISADEDIYIPVSVLNALRRDATEIIDNYLLQKSRKNIDIPENIYSFNKRPKNPENNIDVEILTYEDLKKIKKNVNILLDIRNIDDKIISYIEDNKLKVNIVLPKFENSGELEKDFKFINKISDFIDSIYINNIGQIEIFKKSNYNLVADIGLNVFNSYTARELFNMGFSKVYLSPELNYKQIKDISSKTGGNLGVVAFGLIPVMTMVHCPASIVKICKDSSKCRDCKFSKGYYIKDTMGVDFLVERRNGISEIYNSYPLLLLDKINDFKRSGIDNFRLNIRENINNTIDIFEKAVKGENYSDEILREQLINKYSNITYGHFNRGIINE